MKSCKYHLTRTIGEQVLTYEEFNTLLIQIEAILNSRPLSQLSASPLDPSPLTPAHFLIGRQLTSLPDEVSRDKDACIRTRFQMLQKMQNNFWRQWSRNYLYE